LRDANPHWKFNVELEIRLVHRFELSRTITSDKKQPFSSAMSLQRDLFLMTPGTSVRTVQKYTSDIVSQWKSQMSACHMEKLRFGRAHDLCISSIATY